MKKILLCLVMLAAHPALAMEKELINKIEFPFNIKSDDRFAIVDNIDHFSLQLQKVEPIGGKRIYRVIHKVSFTYRKNGKTCLAFVNGYFSLVDPDQLHIDKKMEERDRLNVLKNVLTAQVRIFEQYDFVSYGSRRLDDPEQEALSEFITKCRQKLAKPEVPKE